jgi:CRP/FNR family transcriptional regulator, cyclic AMP receptor protein
MPRWAELAFTAGFDPSQIARLTEVATPVRWNAGEMIYREGDPGSPLYLVEEGLVAVELVVPGRGPVTILTVSPGDIFGWSSLFYQRPKTNGARALVPTRALALDTARLRALCDGDPAFGYAVTRRILQVVSERLKATRIQLLDVFKS